MNGERIINSTRIEAGDLLVGFGDDSFRSVGVDAAQKAFEKDFGPDWQDETIPIGDRSYKLGELAMWPPTDYTEVIMDMSCGNYVINVPKVEIKGIVKMTSGGIPQQLGEKLRETGLGAEIVDPLEPPKTALVAQFVHPKNISDKEAYSTWCFGHGMIIATPEELDANEAVDIASYHGISAKIIGYVTQQPGIRILSRGIRQPGKMLSFEA